MNKKIRFHRYHGENIVLSNDGTVACRSTGFNNGVVFSERCLKPGELFVVEILDTVEDWNGFMRLGVTQTDIQVFQHRRVPKHSLPDLMTVGSSWIYGVTHMRRRTYFNEDLPWPGEMNMDNITVTDDTIQTCRGTYSKSTLRTVPPDYVESILPVEVGSRVGIVFLPVDDETADLHLVFNGDVFGPVALEIPYKQAPLRAVIDVYGGTKKVKIIQLTPLISLKGLCRDIIRRDFDLNSVARSKLPKPVKDYLL